MTPRVGTGAVMADDGGALMTASSSLSSATAAAVVMGEEGEGEAAEGEDPSPSPPPSLPPMKEWAPLNHLMLQVPAKYQNLLVTGELQLTSVSAVDEHLLLGTNTGSVYWYDTVGCTMRRYRAEGQQASVTRVRAVTSVDHLLAAGHRSGELSVFLVPRLARGEVPDYVRITESNIKKGLQFRVDAGHKSPITALAWSRNAARLFSGDRDGVVAVTEVDYVTETVSCRVLVREPSPVVQLQYSRQTLLVACRGRCCLLAWPAPAGAELTEPRQVGTKPRKSPADLGACILETGDGEPEPTVLAARPSLKVVTADMTGQVSATISLKPTLDTAGPISLLFPISASTLESSPGRLLPLWPGTVALYDNRTLLVVDFRRWEIVWRCDQLPAVLDVACAGDAIFVLCSGRRLIRLSQTPDNHPAVCENMRLANGDLSFDDVMQDLKASMPVSQVKTLLSSVHGQLDRSGILGALSSQKVAVSSLTSRMSSLVTGRLGAAVARERRAASPAGSSPLRAAVSSPDVRGPGTRVGSVSSLCSADTSVADMSVASGGDVNATSADAAAAADAGDVKDASVVKDTNVASAVTDTAATSAAMTASAPSASAAGFGAGAVGAVDDGPIARQLRPRRRPGRRRVGRPASGDARSLGDTRSLETVSLGGETASVAETATATTEAEAEARRRSCVEERVDSETPSGGEERVRTDAERSSDGVGPSEGAGKASNATPDLPSGTLNSAGGDIFEPLKVSTPATPQEPLDFTQFYPRDVRPRLQRTDSELEEERRDKERRLAALLGLEELSAPAPPPPPPPPATLGVASGGSSATPSPPAAEDLHTEASRLDQSPWLSGTSFIRQGDESQTRLDPEEDSKPEPEPSYHSLFPFNTKPSSPPLAPPRPPSADSETGEPRRHVVEVQHPEDTLRSTPASAFAPLSSFASASERGLGFRPDVPPLQLHTQAVDPETGAPTSPPVYGAAVAASTPLTTDGGPTPADDWRPWQRLSAPCYVMTLSACARYAVVTDSDCRVYCTPTSGAGGWEKLDYSACQVAVSWDGARVWRLDASGAAYSLADPEPGRPNGAHWVRAATDVLQLSADAAAVWYIKRGGRLYVQRDLSAHRCASSEIPVDTPGPIIQVTARQGVVWAVTDKGNVLWRVGVSRAQLSGLTWESLSIGPLRARATFLTAGELGWLADDRGRLHVTTGVSAGLPRGMDGVWKRVLAERSSSTSGGRQVAVMAPGAALRPSLAVEGDVAWLAEPGVMNVMTCRHHIIAVRWEQFVPRGPHQEWAEVHADSLYQRRGQLWAVNVRGQLYGGHGHDGDLQVVPLPERACTVACVSAAPGALWLLTASGAVYVRQGMAQMATGSEWTQLDLLQMDGCRLVHLSVGAQSVWACDTTGRVLVRLGPTVARPSTACLLQPAWVSLDRPAGVRFVQVSASCRWREEAETPWLPAAVATAAAAAATATAQKVCVGPADQQVWALDSAGVPWRRVGLREQPVVGTHWQPAGGVSADRLAVSPCGAWARCRRSGLVYRWMETAAQWCRVPGATRHVSVSVSGELWVVHRGALYTLQEQMLQPGRSIEPRVSDRPSPTLGSSPSEGSEDWELVTY